MSNLPARQAHQPDSDLDDCVTVYAGEKRCLCIDDEAGVTMNESNEPCCERCGGRLW